VWREGEVGLYDIGAVGRCVVGFKYYVHVRAIAVVWNVHKLENEHLFCVGHASLELRRLQSQCTF